MKICIILNSRAGEANKLFHLRALEDIVDFFSRKDISITIKTTIHPGDGIGLTRESLVEDYTHIIACGGDGTINEVVNGLAGSRGVLGIIPMGTENVMAKAMGIPLDVPGACRHFLESGEKKMDLGSANGRHFLMMSGIGLDAKVISEMEPEAKKMMGSLAFIFKGAAALFFDENKPRFKTKIRLLDKGKEYDYTSFMVIVGNLANYSGTVKIALNAEPTDGKLDIIVFPYSEDPGKTAYHILQTFMEAHLESGEIPYFTSGDLEITTDPPVGFQVDGELIGKTPVRYMVNPGGINVRF